ncbi:hypothetical protein LCGC14_2319510 [marine sediment metagenome]|uniref:Uncharacterized protein n=1 Tax=marine sediment metagenome TaxID=412755 RepID=A0A0F9EVP9_9ZZZZ
MQTVKLSEGQIETLAWLALGWLVLVLFNQGLLIYIIVTKCK